MSFRNALILILVVFAIGSIARLFPDASAQGASRMDPTSVQRVHFNIYVADQTRSRVFYASVLALKPTLDVPGMTEFPLPGGTILGLAPERDIAMLFGSNAPNPSLAHGIPRAEIYLLVSDPAALHARALAAGARELSPLLPRSWGHLAAYSLDPDGHVLAVAGAIPRVGR